MTPRSLPNTALFLLFVTLAACGGGGGGSSGSGAGAAPHVSFSAQNATGPRPLDVAFVNTTTGAVTTWLWNFGDGATSAEKTPTHRYEAAGTFDVTLTATGTAGSDVLVRTALVRVTAPIVDASFEMQAIGSAPGGAWIAFQGPQGASGHVVRSNAGGGDRGMPSQGSAWCDLSAASTQASVPPSAGAGPTPRNGAGIAQEFTYPSGQSVLQLDALFVNAEGLNQPARNDWMSIDVSDGANTQNLYRRDTTSALERPANFHPGQFTTPLEAVTADLAQLFPGSTFTTVFTLTIQVGNGGDGGNPSSGYVDNVRFSAPGATLTVGFSATPTTAAAGMSVAFTDETQGGPTLWSWDFGDGVSSSMQSPTHPFVAPGVYDVRLRVSKAGVSSELLREDLVTVFAANGVVDFAAAPIPVATNQNVTFTNLSNGAFASYLWDFGDGGTFLQTSLATPVVHAYAAAGSFSVRLTGTYPNLTTTTEFKPNYVQVQAPPAITIQPVSQSVNVGQPATFTVVASGTALHYQWFRQGAAITGAPDQATYTTPPTTAAFDANAYRVRVSNGVGAVDSTTVALTVVSPPVLVQSPQSLTVAVGQPATFSAQATGHNLHYEWQLGTTPIAGAADLPSYTTAATTAGNNGQQYRVRVFNTAGSLLSASATLTVATLPVITTQPVSQTANAGQTATFSVTATGAALQYQWSKNSVAIAGATAATYVTPAVSGSDSGSSFRVAVTNPAGTTNSVPVTLTVNSLPVITTPPAAQTVNVGQTATFNVVATGNNLSYEWQKGGVPIAGATQATYVTPTTTAGDNGTTYRVRVFNSAGSTLSANVLLTVTSAPIIATPPQPVTVASGGTAMFSVGATGANLHYEWQLGTSPIGAPDAPTYVTPATTTANNGQIYRVRVYNGAGEALSDPATLTVVTTPVITTPPTSQSTPAGTAVTFSVVATGGGLSYQWQTAPSGGSFSNLGGATGTSYTTAPAPTIADNGRRYRVQVSNVAVVNPVTSAEAVLTVNGPPVITQDPVNKTVFAGQTAMFSVTATGVGLNYQWQSAEPATPTVFTPISGAIASTYTTPATVVANSGKRYRVVVSNMAAPPATSNPATLTVNGPPVITQDPVNKTVFAGQTAMFSVTATGVGLNYQWQSAEPATPTAFTPISGAIASTYTTPATVLANSGKRYRVVVSNMATPPATSTPATLTVNASPQITAQPVNATRALGASASFNVTAVGIGSLTYKWQGATAAAPTAFTDLQTSFTSTSLYSTGATVVGQNGMRFRVVVKDGNGTEVTSSPATLTLTLTFAALYSFSDTLGGTGHTTFNSCTGCHGSGGGLDLTLANAYDELLNPDPNSGCQPNVARVVVNNASTSLLYKKLLSAPTCGSQMGVGGTGGSASTGGTGLLTSGDIARIALWINSGALEN